MNLEIIKQRIESNKEYLAGLEICRGIVSDDFLEKERLETKMVILALEKQIPQEPTFTADGYFNGQPIYDIWACPNCGKCYEVYYDDYKHCPECGQALDWSDTE